MPLLLLLLSAMTPPEPALQHPNVLLIIADDLGSDWVGVYEQGLPWDQPPTPTIDGLARAGLRFTRAYSYPTCSPTRATILTGRHAFRTGLGWAIFGDDTESQLPYDEITLPELLDRAGSGYDHALIGKWHLGHTFFPLDPVLHGFRWFAGTVGNVSSYYQFPRGVASAAGGAGVTPTTAYATTVVTDDAIAAVTYLREPWFVWVAYHAPHKPLHAPPAHLHTRTDVSTPKGQFQAMIEAFDTELARLLAAVDLARTAVIFVGDNGTVQQFSTAPQGRAKHSLFEGGVRVPLIFAGAGVPREHRGRVCDSLASTVDLYPTIAALAWVNAQAALPKDHALDGVSLLPCLADPETAVREFVFAEKLRPLSGPPYSLHEYMIRGDRFKLMRRRNFTGFREWLYDVEGFPQGRDGPDLCPCPGPLEDGARAAYRLLRLELERMAVPAFDLSGNPGHDQL